MVQRKANSKTAKPLPTIERVRAVFRYNAKTGQLLWAEMVSRRAPVGTVAGSIVGWGYLEVGLDGQRLLVHRVIWFWVTGLWPGRVDHRDLVKTNNKWENLRLASRSQNAANKRKPASNSSGIKGVRARGSRYVAQIKKDGVGYHLGTFDTGQQAADAYAAKAIELFGEFARAA